jgi:exopolysaccharide production protein ExoQ
MPPFVASIVFVFGIAGLFYLDRNDTPRISKALWIPYLWLFLISSRGVALWFGLLTPDFRAVDATDAYVEGSPVDRAVFTILIVAALVVLFKRSDKVGTLLRKNIVVISFFLFCAASIFWSDFPFVAFKRWTKDAFGDVSMVLIILTEAYPLIALKRLLTRLGFLLFPLSVLLIKYYPHIGRRLTNSWTMEPVGVTMQKNTLGLDCLIWGVFFLWIFRCVHRDRENPNRRRLLIAYGTIMAMIIWLLAQCDSTTSIVGFVLTATVMWVAERPRRKIVVVHMLVLGVLCAASFVLFGDRSLVQVVGKNPTLTGRTEIWSMVLGLHSNPWIGTGFESFWLGPRLQFMRDSLPNFPINEAHNGYLEVYLNLGWIGVCFIVVMIVTAYKRAMSHFRQDPWTSMLLVGLLLCTLFNAFTENAFRMLTPSWVFLLLAMMAGSESAMFAVPTRGAAARPGYSPVDTELAYASGGTRPD